MWLQVIVDPLAQDPLVRLLMFIVPLVRFLKLLRHLAETTEESASGGENVSENTWQSNISVISSKIHWFTESDLCTLNICLRELG